MMNACLLLLYAGPMGFASYYVLLRPWARIKAVHKSD